MIDCILKFNEAQYSNKLFDRGQIFMRRLDKFSKINGNEPHRYDPYEGAKKVVNHKNSVLEIKDPDQKILRINLSKSALIISVEDLSKYYVYSLYYFRVTEKEYYHSVDPRMRDFGNKYVLIENSSKFLERIESKLIKLGYEVSPKTVSYYQSDLDQNNLTKFHKRDIHSYQNEIRILAYNGDMTKDHLTFNIGKLNRIAKHLDFVDENLIFKVATAPHNL